MHQGKSGNPDHELQRHEQPSAFCQQKVVFDSLLNRSSLIKESLDWHLSVQDVGRHVALDEVVGAPLDCIQEVVGLGSIS
jgi:hypothetical protein